MNAINFLSTYHCILHRFRKICSSIKVSNFSFYWHKCDQRKPATCRTGQFCRNKQNDLKIVMFLSLFSINLKCILDIRITANTSYYSLIAFDVRVTFWLHRVRSLPCACAYVALFARRLAYNHYAIAHAYNAANAHAQGSDRARWSQKILSRRRQSEYSFRKRRLKSFNISQLANMKKSIPDMSLPWNLYEWSSWSQKLKFIGMKQLV